MARVRTHPGEIRFNEYLRPPGMSADALAQAIEVPAKRIGEHLRGRRGTSAATACRLGRFFAMTPEFRMNLQTAHDLSKAVAKHDCSGLRTLDSAGRPSPA